MRVIMKQTVKLLGTSIVLNEGQTYEAILATNQPDYAEKGLHFVIDPETMDSVLCSLGDEFDYAPGPVPFPNWHSHGTMPYAA